MVTFPPGSLHAQRHHLAVAVRIFIAGAAVLGFISCSWMCLRAGASRMVSDYAMRARLPEAAAAAARLMPSDPEASYAVASLLADVGDSSGAIHFYEQAIALRSRDYLLWIELAGVREGAGDAEGAIAAFRAAVELAPFYAQPRWQLGNTLLRAGRLVEAIPELRQATRSDPSLYPNFVQAAWYAADQNAQLLAQTARPDNSDEAFAVVKFLVKTGAAGEAMRVLRESGASLTTESRHALLADLLAAGNYPEASEVWSQGHDGGNLRGIISDGGFEGEMHTDDDGFGWHFARDPTTLRFSLDANAPREGSRSLRVEFAGNSDPATATVSQLVLVEPRARYRLSFSARTRDLVTGGLPFVEIVSAAKGGGLLASTPPLKLDVSDWRDYAVEFVAPAGTEAVRLALRRQPCSGSPCPAFGTVWLDSFDLRKL